jgi:hypothetical protein
MLDGIRKIAAETSAQPRQLAADFNSRHMFMSVLPYETADLNAAAAENKARPLRKIEDKRLKDDIAAVS